MIKQGLVIKATGSWYSVSEGNIVIQCRIKGKLRLNDITTTNPITIGDIVNYELQSDNTGVILNVETRKNYIARKSTSFSKEAHLLAANIDQVFIMVCLKLPETPFEFIDRFLVTTEAYHIKSIVLVNKTDLLVNEESIILDNFIKTYHAAGYNCLDISVKENHKLDVVKNLMLGKLSLLAGNSGVGKSSLINALCPSLNLKTCEISESNKSGKHTTTFSEMFQLDNSSFIIDSPGIKGFGLIDLKKPEIGLYFPEIFRISKNCKYYNCLHLHEPSCSVIQSVEEGIISKSRYQSYLNIITESNSKYR